MKNDQTELVFILDRSGSMHGLESDTIGGFNSVIEEQKKLDGRVFVSTVLFSDTYKLLHQRVPILEIYNMTTNDYKTQGMTALLDAIGKTIQMIESTIELTENKPGKVLFVIITDGLENASREYRYGQINSMIEVKKRVGWEFFVFRSEHRCSCNSQAFWNQSRYGSKFYRRSGWNQTPI